MCVIIPEAIQATGLIVYISKTIQIVLIDGLCTIKPSTSTDHVHRFSP